MLLAFCCFPTPALLHLAEKGNRMPDGMTKMLVAIIYKRGYVIYSKGLCHRMELVGDIASPSMLEKLHIVYHMIFWVGCLQKMSPQSSLLIKSTKILPRRTCISMLYVTRNDICLHCFYRQLFIPFQN